MNESRYRLKVQSQGEGFGPNVDHDFDFDFFYVLGKRLNDPESVYIGFASRTLRTELVGDMLADLCRAWGCTLDELATKLRPIVEDCLSKDESAKSDA